MMLPLKSPGSRRNLRLLAIVLTCSTATVIFVLFLYFPQSSTDTAANRYKLVSPRPYETPVILFWTKLFGSTWVKEGVDQCNEQYQCYFTNNHALYDASSLIIFHAGTINLEQYINDLRALQRPIGQRWVYVNSESPPRSIQRSLKGPIFNWTMTYKLDADVYCGYGQVDSGKYQDGFDPHKNYLEGKNIEATAVISNCRNKDRMKLVRALSEHMQVNLLGGCGEKRVSVKERDSQIKRSKFYLAFENSICKDYITEKAYRNALANGAVPVIMSGANLSNPLVMPPESYIDASKFKSAKELAQHLKYIGQNKEHYNNFFKWRQHWTIIKDTDTTYNHKCNLCEKLHKSKPTDIKVYDDLSGLKEREIECKSYPSW